MANANAIRDEDKHESYDGVPITAYVTGEGDSEGIDRGDRE
jgi:hypothetical protein